MRIIVFGATGILGRRAVPLLLDAGHAVTAVGRAPDRLAALATAGASVATIDMFDRDAVARAVAGHAAVVNLATHIPPIGPRAFLVRAWRENDRVRRDASAILADAAVAAGVGRLVQESFAYLYADAGSRWVDESTPPRPAPHARSALDAEASATRLTAAGGVGVALRFALLYGGAEDGFTRDALRSARRGWLPVVGRPEGYLSLVTHDDAARAVVAALTAPAGVYHVADDAPLTRRALADVLGAVLGVPAPRLPPHWLARLTGSVGETIGRSLRLSNHALRATTGWAPTSPTARHGWHAAVAAIVAAEREAEGRVAGAEGEQHADQPFPVSS